MKILTLLIYTGFVASCASQPQFVGVIPPKEFYQSNYNENYSGPSDEELKKLNYGQPPAKAKVSKIFKVAVQENLKDPESIKIRNIKPAKKVWYQVLQDQEIQPCWMICGEYDAKNSFGGYGGYSEIPVCYNEGKAWAMTAYQDRKEMLPFSNHPYPCSE